jgi:hypothetical protein
MIVKKVKRDPDAKPKPKAWQIGDLVDYIRQPRTMNPEEKIEYAGSRNFLSKTHAGQRGEMIGLASESIYSKMPVSHWIFSWAEGEQPSADQVDELVDVFLENMGLAGCQTIYGLHYNTENYHVHIAVNRMNPETMKVIQPHKGYDLEEAHKILALIEKKQGWASEQNARYAVNESGETLRKTPQESAPKPKGKAQDFECRTGEKSAQRIAQERGHAIMKNAKSWPELHGKLAEAGLRFERKGSGAIVFVGESVVKASSIDRAFSLKNLCKKLGDFEPGNYSVDAEKIEPEPVSSVNFEEWQTYRVECEEIRQVPPAPVVNSAVLAMKIRHKQERKDLLRDLAGRGFAALNIARKRLSARHKAELRRLRQETKIPERVVTPRFENWLRARGLTRQADLWRYKNRAMPKIIAAPPKPKTDSFAVYAACWDILHKKNLRLAALTAGMALLGKISEAHPEALSRLDARTALLMRAQGHSREDIVEALRRHALETREERRDWARYAERAVAYAFSAAGDVALAQQSLVQLEEARPELARPAPMRMRMR